MVKKSKNVNNKKTCNSGEDCKCNNKNKFVFVFGIVLFFIVVAFCVGVAVGGYLLFSDDSNEDENIVFDTNLITVELYDDEEFYHKDISLKNEDDIKNFIKSTDYGTGEEERKAFLEGDNGCLAAVKLAYVLGMHDAGGRFYLDLGALEVVIGRVFSNKVEEFGEQEYGEAYLAYADLVYMCDNDGICLVDFGIGGGAGDDHYVTEIVSSRKEGDNTIYTLKDYYVEFQGGIYNSSGGELLCEDDCPVDIISTYSEKLNTYEMTFNKDNKYVSSKKVK